MNVLAVKLDIAKALATELTQHLVMIAGHKNDARALFCFAQQCAQHVAVLLRPVNALAQAPQINDVAHQIQLFHID